MPDHPIPVTLLTGFLGSGKTTLLNHLLRDPGIGCVAVIINEFGDIGLDHDLIEEATEEMVLMQSGCLCCSIRGDLARTMLELLHKRTSGEIWFDRVVIETTGLADPGPILHTLLVERELAHAFALDGMVTTADAAVGSRTLDTQFEAVNQIALADRIVLTKTDLVMPSERTAFEARIAAINPGAPRLVADHGQLPPGVLFGIGGMVDDAPTEQTLAWVNAAAYATPIKPRAVFPVSNQQHGLFRLGSPAPDPLAGLSMGFYRPPTLQITLPDTTHDSRISSVSATIDDPIPAGIFDFWLDMLITNCGPDILRLKGIVHVEGVEHPFALHGVQHVFHPPVPLKRWPSDDRKSRLVVIGRDIPKDVLQASLAVLNLRPKTSAVGGMMMQTLELPF